MSVRPDNIGRLLDERAITKLIYRFSTCLDARDWRGYGETFTDDGVFEIFGQHRTGRDAVANGARELEHFALTQHFNTNIVVEIDGNDATASSSLLAVHVPDRADPATHADVGAVYRYQCVRIDDGWQFRQVRVDIAWTAGLPIAAELAKPSRTGAP